VPADRICVGAISGAFGVRGEAKIKCFTDDPAAVGDYGPLETREDAEALKGTRLYAERSALPPPDDEEFYYADLLGLRVEMADGTVLGKVKAVQDFGAGDVIEYLPAGGGESLYLPFTREVVPTVDVAGGRVVVELPGEESDG